MRSKVAWRVCLNSSLRACSASYSCSRPFLFLPPLLRSPFLHLSVLTLLLLILLLSRLGLLLRLLFRCGCHGGCGVGNLSRGCAWVVDRAVVVGAYGDGGAYPLAVDDDGGFDGGAR